MQRFALLNERGSFASDHPESVATTFSLAFQKVQENNSSAAELLRLCTFLHPDVIPEEVFTDYKPTLDPTLPPIVADQFQLNTAIKSLLKFSLVRRNPDTKTLTIHRLVQAVLKDKMDKHMQSQWAERTVRSVSRSFPFARPETWQACQRLLPHAYTSTELIEHWNIEIIEAAGLLYRMGKYLDDLALYEEAKLCYQRALIICEKVRGLEDVDVAKILSPLAEVYSQFCCQDWCPQAIFGAYLDLYGKPLVVFMSRVGFGMSCSLMFIGVLFALNSALFFRYATPILAVVRRCCYKRRCSVLVL
jgi:hypothetical protein